MEREAELLEMLAWPVTWAKALLMLAELSEELVLEWSWELLSPR